MNAHRVDHILLDVHRTKRQHVPKQEWLEEADLVFGAEEDLDVFAFTGWTPTRYRQDDRCGAGLGSNICRNGFVV